MALPYYLGQWLSYGLYYRTSRDTRYFRNYETERRENLTQSSGRKMQFSDAI